MKMMLPSLLLQCHLVQSLLSSGEGTMVKFNGLCGMFCSESEESYDAGSAAETKDDQVEQGAFLIYKHSRL